MAEKTYQLTAPNGTQVEVTGAERRDTLLARGYTEGHGGRRQASREQGKGDDTKSEKR
jgi:hypothetical protein